MSERQRLSVASWVALVACVTACSGGAASSSQDEATPRPSMPTTEPAASSTAAASPSANASGDQCVPSPLPATTLAGTFESTITEADMTAVGVTGHDATENLGTFTLTLEAGAFSLHQAPPNPVRWPDFAGRYLVSLDRVSLRVESPAEFSGDVECKSWRRDGGSIIFDHLAPPGAEISAVWESHPWTPRG